jgi:hypothetical protein
MKRRQRASGAISGIFSPHHCGSLWADSSNNSCARLSLDQQVVDQFYNSIHPNGQYIANIPAGHSVPTIVLRDSAQSFSLDRKHSDQFESLGLDRTTVQFGLIKNCFKRFQFNLMAEIKLESFAARFCQMRISIFLRSSFTVNGVTM